MQNIGNSGQPGSPHYADQFGAWLAGNYYVVSLQRADVERDFDGMTILEPHAERFATGGSACAGRT